MRQRTRPLRGTLSLPSGRTLAIRDWRASLEHAWGDLLLDDPQWDFWDEAIIHDRGGRAWVAYGLDRSDMVTGPGARDAQWLGLVARVDRRGVHICRPRLDRRGWLLDYADFSRWPTRLRLHCAGMALRVRERLGAVTSGAGSASPISARRPSIAPTRGSLPRSRAEPQAYALRYGRQVSL